MDSDAKELGHVRVADRKTALGYQGWNVIIHSRVGNGTPDRKFASDVPGLIAGSLVLCAFTEPIIPS